MKILLKRIYNCTTYCISHIYVDGEYVCDAVEDYDRGLDQSMTLNEIKKRKVYRMTAIPTGTYEVTMNIQSPKFSQYKFYMDLCKGYLPRILNIKGFDGVLFHCGSSAASSAGCVICGYNKIKGRVVDSQKAFTKLMKQHFIPAKMLGEKIILTITRTYKTT
ncbi:MAG: hypothetical protein J5529_02990 [Prevotella sp.]|nr:hypothetical protein [Prevotella sp.]